MRSPDGVRRLVVWMILGTVCLGALFSCGRRGGPSKAPRDPEEDAEFKRHLRLGIEQLRRFLPDSAEAEFNECAALDPEDPELLFHRARLKLIPKGGRWDPEGAVVLLEQVVTRDPSMVKAHRLLQDLHEQSGHTEKARADRKAVERLYGLVGEWEMLRRESMQAAGEATLPAWDPGAANASDYVEMTQRFTQLSNRGTTYAPTEAVPRLEKLFHQYPDLAYLRLRYARYLAEEGVRVNYSDQPDLPRLSSKTVMDIAQTHIERVFDQIGPNSPLAMLSLDILAKIALQMANYDEVIGLVDMIEAQLPVPDQGRDRLLMYEALAHYKQGRFREASRVLEEALFWQAGDASRRLVLSWLLHLSYEKGRVPPGERAQTFLLRPDLVEPGTRTKLRFVDIAAQRGVDKLDGAGPSAWGDFDGDGDYDLFVTGIDTYGSLFRNDNGYFTDVSREAGLFQVESGFSSTFADFDNNGRPDLYIGRDGWGGPAANGLYRNNGDGTFTDITKEAGVGDPGSAFVHAWSDIDRDGDIDLYVANGITGGGDTNVMYRNNGDGTFTDVTVETGCGVPVGTKTIGVVFGDYDLDRWPDLFVSGFKITNRLFHNKGDGTFEEVGEKAGVGGPEHVTAGYVCFFMDYDNDTYPDILRTALASFPDVILGMSADFGSVSPTRRKQMQRDCPKLFRNNRDGTFTDVSVQAGLIHPTGTMGAGVADLDNDGYLDIYLATGDPAIERMEPDRFLRNNGDGTFTDLTFVTGLGHTGKGHGITFIDLDGDGDLEIYAPEGGFVHGDLFPCAFYLNNMEPGNGWLHVDLEGVKSNRDALDTRLVATAGKLRVMREVKNSEGFGSTNSHTVEFGLGKARRIDRLEVYWPSGLTQTFEDIPINGRISIREGEPWKKR